VGESVVADGVGERAGERRYAAVRGDVAASGGELGADEAGDVVVGEFLEADRSERGNEVLVDVVEVAGHRGRLQRPLFDLEPRLEMLGHGLAVVDVDAGLFAGQHPVQRGAGLVLGGEAAAAQGLAVSIDGRQVDGAGRRPVPRILPLGLRPVLSRSNLVTSLVQGRFSRICVVREF
jgi:hypothetical protein